MRIKFKSRAYHNKRESVLTSDSSSDPKLTWINKEHRTRDCADLSQDCTAWPPTHAYIKDGFAWHGCEPSSLGCFSENKRTPLQWRGEGRGRKHRRPTQVSSRWGNTFAPEEESEEPPERRRRRNSRSPERHRRASTAGASSSRRASTPAASSSQRRANTPARDSSGYGLGRPQQQQQQQQQHPV